MLISEILNSAARKLGLIASNESLTTFEMANSLTILQTMLRSWSSELINVSSSVNETHSLKYQIKTRATKPCRVTPS
jgi:hypothetical protein